MTKAGLGWICSLEENRTSAINIVHNSVVIVLVKAQPTGTPRLVTCHLSFLLRWLVIIFLAYTTRIIILWVVGVSTFLAPAPLGSSPCGMDRWCLHLPCSLHHSDHHLVGRWCLHLHQLGFMA